MENLALSIDIGGTNCAFGLVKKNGEIVYINNVKTNSFKNSKEIVEYLNNDTTIKYHNNKIICI